MATKPDIIIENEARQMIANGINYTSQQTGISMLRLEPILKEMYNEVKVQAEQEYANLQAQYEREVAEEAAAAETPKDEN